MGWDLACVHHTVIPKRTAVHCRQRAGNPIQLLMSDASGPEGPRNLYIFERWCPLVLSIEGDSVQSSHFCINILLWRLHILGKVGWKMPHSIIGICNCVKMMFAMCSQGGVSYPVHPAWPG